MTTRTGKTSAATLRTLAAGRKAPKSDAPAFGTVRVGFYASADLRRRLRVAAAERGVTITQLILDALRHELGEK